MNIGSLYQINKFHWFLYPSKDIAAAGRARAAALVATNTERWSAQLSKQFNCNVSFIAQNSMFVLLEQDGKYYKVLSTEGNIGWIIYPENEHWAKGCIEENPFTSPEPCDRVET